MRATTGSDGAAGGAAASTGAGAAGAGGGAGCAAAAGVGAGGAGGGAGAAAGAGAGCAAAAGGAGRAGAGAAAGGAGGRAPGGRGGVGACASAGAVAASSRAAAAAGRLGRRMCNLGDRCGPGRRDNARRARGGQGRRTRQADEPGGPVCGRAASAIPCRAGCARLPAWNTTTPRPAPSLLAGSKPWRRATPTPPPGASCRQPTCMRSCWPASPGLRRRMAWVPTRQTRSIREETAPTRPALIGCTGRASRQITGPTRPLGMGVRPPVRQSGCPLCPGRYVFDGRPGLVRQTLGHWWRIRRPSQRVTNRAPRQTESLGGRGLGGSPCP